MKRWAIALPLLLAACVVPPPADTARLPPGAFGIGFNGDVELIKRVQYDWATSGRLHETPAEPARAVGGLDYLAGLLNTDPVWADVPAITQLQLLTARHDVRAALGIPQSARSQAVVDGMDRAFRALARNDQREAAAALTGPAFPLGGPETLRSLATLPPISSANVATQNAGQSLFGPAGNSNGGQ